MNDEEKKEEGLKPPEQTSEPIPETKQEMKKKEKKKRTLFHKTVNVFLSILLGLVVIILLFFGFMQTSTFRELLRTNLIEIVNGEIKGKINLEKIDGTILTSLVLRNASLTYEGDTIAAFNKLSVKVSPFRILFKQIVVREIGLYDLTFRLVEDSAGVLNIAKAFPTSPDEDTTSSEFNFQIIVSKLAINNLNFSFQKEKYVKSTSEYDYFNLDDFRVNNLNLALSAFADISKNKYELTVDEFNSKINLSRFNLNDFRGKFAVSESEISVTDFIFASDSSSLETDLKVTGLNIFGEINEGALKKVKVDVDLTAGKFNFSDIASYVPAVDILKGAIEVEMSGSGNLSEFDLRVLNVMYGETELKTAGKLYNLNNPENLYISTLTSGSELRYADIMQMLPGVVPDMFKDLPLISIDTLRFSGSPTNFTATFGMTMEDGSLSGSASMDINSPEMRYDVKLNTGNLDLSSFLKMPATITTSAEIKGAGTDPKTMDLIAKINVSKSSIRNYSISRIDIKTEAKRGKGFVELNGLADSSKINFTLNSDFSNLNNLTYEFAGSVEGINLGQLVLPELITDRFNIRLSGKGRNYDPENLEANINLDLTNLEIRNNSLDEIKFNLVAKSGAERKKLVDLKSTLMDFYLEGTFSYDDLAAFIITEAEGLQKSITDKLDNYFPKNNILSKTIVDQKILLKKKVTESKILPQKGSGNSLHLSYKMEMKELDLVSALLNFEDFSVDGHIEGELKKEGGETALSTKIQSDFFKNKINGESLFLTGASLEFSTSHPTANFDLDKIKLNTDLSIKRIFFGTEIKDVSFNLNLNKSLIKTTASADITADLRVETELSANIATSELAAGFQKLKIDYKKISLQNKRDFTINYINEKIKINDFNLYRNESAFLIDGLVDPNGEQDLKITISKFKGYDIGYSVLELSPENMLDYDLNLDATVGGTFASPLLSINLGVKDLKFREKLFGSLVAKFDYSKMNLLTDISFGKDKDTVQLPLQIKGNVPVDLSLSAVKERLPKDKDVNLTIYAKDFDLASFGDALPFVNDLKGIISSDIVLSGPYDNLSRRGNLSVRKVSFLAEPNNLSYGAGLTLRLEDEAVFIDSILVENIGNVPYKGVMRGSGRMDFKGMDLVKTQFLIGGNLQVLSYESKNASPAVYGDLFISTEDDIIFAMTPDRTFLKAYIKINNANLYFPPLQSSYSGSSSNFVYKYVETGKTLSEREAEIQRIVSESRARTEEIFIESRATSVFDYDIKVRISDEARITFMLAAQANQKLMANIKGVLTYENTGGIQNIQGELQLLEGSTLEFLKTFSASGTIKFESDLTNPYLDITATYKNYRISTESGSEGKETEVAVKIKLRGTVKDLSSNFAQMEDNIAVYEGSENIQNDKASADKEKADAIWFILTGKFTNETTSQERQQSAGMIEGTATSLAGSLLGGVLNTYLGDYVRTLDVRSSGTATKFSLTGTIKGLRYTIGGSTNFLQDLSNANIRIEYPLIENLFLRVERRESITETNYPTEMINELGLKYRFEF